MSAAQIIGGALCLLVGVFLGAVGMTYWLVRELTRSFYEEP